RHGRAGCGRRNLGADIAIGLAAIVRPIGGRRRAGPVRRVIGTLAIGLLPVSALPVCTLGGAIAGIRLLLRRLVAILRRLGRLIAVLRSLRRLVAILGRLRGAIGGRN